MNARTALMAALLCGVPAAAAAQDTTMAIRPGMSMAEVQARWGEPLAVRQAGNWTYLFYENNDPYYHDVVFLLNNQVVDAIVREPSRTYLGQSSSPPGRTPEFTPPASPRNPQSQGAAGSVTGVRVTPQPPELE